MHKNKDILKNIPFMQSLLSCALDYKIKQLSDYNFDRLMIAKFIMYLWGRDLRPVKEKVKIIYTDSHPYNRHPFTYEGHFSPDKMLIHLLNKQPDELLQIVKEMI